MAAAAGACAEWLHTQNAARADATVGPAGCKHTSTLLYTGTNERPTTRGHCAADTAAAARTATSTTT